MKMTTKVHVTSITQWSKWGGCEAAYMYYCVLYNIKINFKRVAKVDLVHRLILSGLLCDMQSHIRLKRAKIQCNVEELSTTIIRL